MAATVVVKHTRVEVRENRHGRIVARTVTTWDVVRAGNLLSECGTRREATAYAAQHGAPQPPRYVVKTREYFGIGRKTATPHAVVDTTTSSIVDEYASKRAASMHARDLNAAAAST